MTAELQPDAERLAELRHSHRSARRSIGGAERRQAEAAITSHVLSLPQVLSAGVVSAFNADDGEPDIAPIIAGLRHAGCEVALPILRAGVMRFRLWSPGAGLVAGDFGLLEPEDGQDIGAAELGASLTPLVAFDPSCNRIGRGAGFYDRTFGPVVARKDRSTSTRPLLVGVAFEAQRADTVPVREHDVPMDVIVTDLGIRHR